MPRSESESEADRLIDDYLAAKRWRQLWAMLALMAAGVIAMLAMRG